MGKVCPHTGPYLTCCWCQGWSRQVQWTLTPGQPLVPLENSHHLPCHVCQLPPCDRDLECISCVNRLLRMTSHFFFLFHVQIYILCLCTFSSLWISAASSQLEDEPCISALRGNRWQLNLSCSHAQDTKIESVQASPGLSCSVPVGSLTLLDSTQADLNSAFKIKLIYLFLSLILGQDVRTRVFN